MRIRRARILKVNEIPTAADYNLKPKSTDWPRGIILHRPPGTWGLAHNEVLVRLRGGDR